MHWEKETGTGEDGRAGRLDKHGEIPVTAGDGAKYSQVLIFQ